VRERFEDDQILGDRDRCAALYPVMQALAAGGLRRDYAESLGPMTPGLAMGIAANAAGEFDLARSHFEDALRFEEARASRFYQSSVRFLFGRHLTAREDVDSRSRGVALLAEAAAQLAGLGMVIHQQHAERELRSV
jgi:hypothetical protein